MADSVIVGRFAGAAGLAAIDSVFQLFKFPLNFLSGLGAGASIVVSKYCGAKDEKKLEASVHTAALLGLVMGIVLSIIGALAAPALIKLMNVPADIYDMALLYVRIFFAGLWTTTMFNLLSAVLRAVGDSKTPLIILAVCCVANIILDIVAVGLLKWGVAGAALATILSQLISVVLSLRSMITNPACRFSFRKLRMSKDMTMEIMKVGLPVGTQSLLYPIANAIIASTVNGLGTIAIAAKGIGSKLDMLVWLITDTLNPCLAAWMAQNLAAGKKDRIKKGMLTGVSLAVAATVLISVILFFFGSSLGKLFLQPADYNVVPVIGSIFHIEAPFFFMYVFAQGVSGAICGTGDTVRPMVCTMLGTCLLRVLWTLIIVKRWFTIEVVCWGYVASWVVTGVVFIVYYLIIRSRGFLSKAEYKKCVIGDRSQ